MRIYASDGSYTENVKDTDFGWFLDDRDIDPEEEYYKEKEKKIRFETQMREALENADSFPDWEIIDCEPIVMIQPNVKVHGVEDAIECEDMPQHTMRNRLMNDVQSIESQSPTKEEIANLIEPYSIQSGTLLSVVSNAQLLKYKSKYLQLFIAARASAYRYLIKDKEEIVKLVDDFNLTRSKIGSPVSLLLELIFTDKSAPIDYFLFNTKANESGALLRSLLRQQSQENFGKAKCETDSGVDESLSSNNSELRNEVLEMHQSFENMNTKVERLIEKAEKLEKELIQTTYLDDLLHLLNGEVEKVKTIKLPFCTFTSAADEETVNWII
ncbi:hypothetical protein WA026_017067 [Henosepilachna vigintioctopunctata]|uniref:Uncharacterized protein n=1 Tax=Henosepilachna vigintioctopunctata TaxID=420089 RepID=A0AAW1TX57_9CUCU